MLGHDEHHAIAADRGGHRERDAGIAGGRLDQRVAGLDRAAPLGVADHRHRRPVLDRAGGVVPFQLRQYHVLIRTGQALQPHERRVADEILDRALHFFCSSAT
jgi:hypothetical protein